MLARRTIGVGAIPLLVENIVAASVILCSSLSRSESKLWDDRLGVRLHLQGVPIPWRIPSAANRPARTAVSVELDYFCSRNGTNKVTAFVRSIDNSSSALLRVQL